MTVSYSLLVATASARTSLFLLLRWRGSLWKVVYKEFIVWLLLLIASTLLYYFVIKSSSFDSDYKWFVNYVDAVSAKAPVLIVLSFVTNIVLTRWQSVYLQFLWPENVALTLKYFINEHMPDSKSILTVAQRYFLLCAALVFRDVNVQIRDHYFPTYESFIEKGLLTKEEKDIMFSTQLKPTACRYWFPLLWVIQLVKKRYNAKKGLLRTRKEALILEKHYCELVNAINDYRAGISDIMSYDFIPIPLALTQLFTFFIYSTLFLGIFSFQSRVFDSMQAPDASLPTVLSIQFISAAMFNLFFIGWLRIAHIILNPFGEDDNDFPMCELLEQYCDSLYQILCVPTDVPIYKKGDKPLVPKLRHTVASAFLKRGGNKPDIGSAVNGGNEMDEQREKVIFVRSSER